MKELALLITLALFAFVAGLAGAAPASACGSSGAPLVTTDKDDYAAFETAFISGSGFDCGETLSLLITAPDGTIYSADGSGANGPDLVTADENGEFTLPYALSGSLADGELYQGQEGTYAIEVSNFAGDLLAAATFTDGPTYALNCAVSSGEVKCWGYNGGGALGNGTTAHSSTPVTVQGLTDVAEVTTGFYHACARTNSGEAYCWGANSRGQLGDGTSSSSDVPVIVSGLSSGVVQISAGSEFTCALLADGTAKCWGFNNRNQLGTGSNSYPSYSPVPISVVGLSDIIQLSAGTNHACALLGDGTVKCWGHNYFNQLGIGGATTTLPFGSASPVTALAAAGLDVTQLSAGSGGTCALTSTGGLYCWGGGSPVSSNTAVSIPGLTTGVTQVSVGTNSSCAVTASGDAKCWGSGLNGALGNGSILSSSGAVFVSGMQGITSQIHTNQYHACALTTSGHVKCWGQNNYGQLGIGIFSSGSPDYFTTPQQVVGLSSAELMPDVIPSAPADSTPPEVAATISGSMGSNSWYTGDVTITWSVSDPESDVIEQMGCTDVTVDYDTESKTFTCTATSAGGTIEESVTIKRDATPPELTINTPQEYDVQPVGTALEFSADDVLSGVDGTAVATVSDASGSSAAASGDVLEPGVYTVVVSATDLAGNTATSEPHLLVIYDPEGGFVTGGGWIDSPAGAYLEDPALTGKASFGFVSKYKTKGGVSELTGNTEFQFKAGDLNFHSTSYDWLVVPGKTQAKFKGEGMVNGQEGYGFMLTAQDNGSSGDTFRIKIWDADENVYYDNHAVSDDLYEGTGIGGGSIVIHTRGK